MPHDTNGPLCKCGCGEGLPTGSSRAYKRGHAKAHQQSLAKGYVRSLRQEEAKPFQPPSEEIFNDLGTSWDTIPNPFETMSESLPDDPEPDTIARDNTSSKIIHPEASNIVVTKAVARDIQGKVAFLLSMPASMLQPIDPVCFPVLLEQTPEISAKLTPIICQSPDMVKFFTKGAGFILWLNLAVSVWPVVQVVIAHHLSKRQETDANGNPIPHPVHDYSKYTA